jgi:hypothetical protein
MSWPTKEYKPRGRRAGQTNSQEIQDKIRATAEANRAAGKPDMRTGFKRRGGKKSVSE